MDASNNEIVMDIGGNEIPKPKPKKSKKKKASKIYVVEASSSEEEYEQELQFKLEGLKDKLLKQKNDTH